MAAQPSGSYRTRNRFRGATSAGEHRPERAAAEQVDVEVRHFLAAMRADIGEQPVAGRDQPLLAGNPADGADEARNLLCRAALGEIVPRDIGLDRKSVV